MTSLKVLVVGSGIAGPALAHWLSLAGCSITLIERAAHLRTTGQQLDLRSQGVPIMRKMGIEAAVLAKVCREPGAQFIDVRGRTQAYFPAAGIAGGKKEGKGRQSLTSDYEIMRGDLVDILTGLTEGKANVRKVFGTTVTGLTQDDESEANGKVHVTFQDGQKDDFDLVVGADGTGSRTRKLMLGPDFPDPRHWTGGYIGYFSIPSRPDDTNRFTFCLLPSTDNARCVITRQDRPDLLRVYFLTWGKNESLDKAYKSAILADQKKAWADLYRDGGWQCDRFVDGLLHAPEADDLYYTPKEEVRLPPGCWSRGRVVLLGDAAWSSTGGGYGTSWALVGAYILAGEIVTRLTQKPTSPTAAIVDGARAYEEIFRPVATQSHGRGEWVGSLMAPRSRWGIRVFHFLTKMAASVKLDKLAGFDFASSKWEVPEYPVLEKEAT